MIICDLVKIACDAIFYNGIPQYEDKLCKYYKFSEIKKLQQSIRTYADRNKDGILDAEECGLLVKSGCDVVELERSGVGASLDTLSDNAMRIGILPFSYSATLVRKSAFNAAHAKAEAAFGPQINEVYDLIDRMNWICPKFTEKQIAEIKMNQSDYNYFDDTCTMDYRTWKTWEKGIKAFFWSLVWMLPSLFSVIWFMVSTALSAISSLSFQKHGRTMSIITSLAFLFILLFFMGPPRSLGNSPQTYNIVALVVFSVIAGLSGYNLSGYITDRRKWRIWFLLIVGILLLSASPFLIVSRSMGPWYFIEGIWFTRIYSDDSSWNLMMFSIVIILVSLSLLYRFYRQSILSLYEKLKLSRKNHNHNG